MSEIKVNLVTPRSGTTVTLGESGDTINIPCGAIIANAGTATGFGLNWCSAVKTAGFTAVAGNGYFINTCGGTFEVTLPATASVGDEINFTDYARTWATACKEFTLDQNSLKFQGNTSPKPEYDTAGATVKIVYSGATQGWLPQLDKGTELETPQTYTIQYLVVAGGGGGSAGLTSLGGGGGAGGYRTVATKSFTVSPGSPYPVVVGGGGAAGPGTAPSGPGGLGGNGCSSVFSTITSAGGGRGGRDQTASPISPGAPGGSGGGGGYITGTGGCGNDPAVPCTQGNDGGDAKPGGPPIAGVGGGGGGHTAVGVNGTPTGAGCGGAGTVNGIRGAPFDPVAYAGGGGGGNYCTTPSGAGGAGGGGSGGGPGPINSTAGTTNSGGGGGGGAGGGDANAAAGGSGIVIIRRLTACSTSTSGTPTVCGSDTIHTFTGDGTFVA